MGTSHPRLRARWYEPILGRFLTPMLASRVPGISRAGSAASGVQSSNSLPYTQLQGGMLAKMFRAATSFRGTTTSSLIVRPDIPTTRAQLCVTGIMGFFSWAIFALGPGPLRLRNEAEV